MSSLRVVLTLLALVAAAAFAEPVPAQDEAAGAGAPLRRVARGTKDQSISLGTKGPYDRLLASRSVYKSSSFLRQNEEKVILTLSAGTITHIKIDDLLKNGDNAEVKVKSGGIGHRDVTLKFKSQRGEKISYYVAIWGM